MTAQPLASGIATPEMREAQSDRALVISTVGTAETAALRVGSASYSYYYVYETFVPLLRRWGNVTVADVADLDAAVRATSQRHAQTIHLGFRPLDSFHTAAGAPNVAFPFWDFPDVPDYALGGDPRNDWAGTASGLDLILTASQFTRDAFDGAGVRVPISVVPVPVEPAYFNLSPWEPRRRTFDWNAHTLAADVPRVSTAPARAKRMYQRMVRPRLSHRAADLVRAVGLSFSATRQEWHDNTRPALPAVPCVELSGIVYTAVLNPFDQRKNWEDLLTAFLFALGSCDDATLIMKLAVPPDRATLAVNRIVRFWRLLGIAHRCKVIIVSAYLTDQAMLDLTNATTYYVNASRAEGACLPLQTFLAAGRPAIAPRHSAITEYFDDDCGFVVESHPEPTSWPQDPEGRYTTTWHRLVWTSLRDRIAESYRLANNSLPEYRRMSSDARAKLQSLVGAEAVWNRLRPALDSIATETRHAF